jgi:hypothetical protein
MEIFGLDYLKKVYIFIAVSRYLKIILKQSKNWEKSSTTLFIPLIKV